MAATSHDHFWPELRQRGLLGPAEPRPLGGGNLDRRAEHAKSVYQIVRPDGSAAKLTIGRDLTDVAAHSRAWARACPTLASHPLFQLRLGDHDLFAEDYFDGVSLETAVLDRSIPAARIHRALLQVTATLRNTVTPSTAADRIAEWEAWSAQIRTLPVWNAGETAVLDRDILPALAAALLQGPPAQGWTHGDLTGQNLLLDAAGRTRLIDPEFSRQTHFFPTEITRFHALSACAREQPGLFAAVRPEPNAAWQLHFWLTQIQRESDGNDAGYLAKWLPHRLAAVRRRSETLLGRALPDCPWPAAPPDLSAARDTAQLFWSAPGGWDEAHSTRIDYRRDQPQTLFFPIANGRAPWRLDPAASAATTIVRRLGLYSADHDPIAAWSGVGLHPLSLQGLEDTSVKVVPDGLAVAAPRGDPQLASDLHEILQPKPAAWLEVELCTVLPSTASPSIPESAFSIEESRWADQPAPFALRIAGWCLAPDAAGLSSVEAVVAGKVIATSESLPRPDVQAAFPTRPGALQSGFALPLPFVDDRAFIELVAVTTSGAKIPFYTVQAGDLPNRGPIPGDYPTWAKLHDPDPVATQAPESATLRFSILLPVFNTPEGFLRACVASVRQQHHRLWELCIVDDASSADGIASFLAEAAQADSRIRFQRRSENGGIARATNDALAMATGDFVVMLDHDDLLRPHALAEFAARLAAEPTLDALYSDEDKISAEGQRLIPFFKPAYSPEFLLGVMYVGHALCVRTSIARAAGGFDPAYDGVQDYEFFLRVTGQTRRIGHLPRILYHWRQSPASSALHGNVKGDMDRRQAEAVQAHLRRRGDPRRVTPQGGHRVRVTAEKSPATRVALLLAWPAESIRADCDGGRLTAGAASVYALSDLDLPAPVADVTRIAAQNWRDALPRIASLSTAGVVVVLTTPPQSLSDDWLANLATLAALSDSGCVAPVLLSQEGKVFESGWTMSAGGAQPLMRGFDPAGDGYNGSLSCTREVAAVSPLCFAVRRELLAGFSPTALASWFDLCRDLRRRGLFHRVCAAAEVRVPHSWRRAEPSSAHPGDAISDPFFNPHFDSVRANYTLAASPPIWGITPPPFVWHLDLAPPEILDDGCLTVHGWCFRPDRRPVTVRIDVAGIAWAARCEQPRPDVAAQYPGLADGGCGFLIRLALPPGRHAIDLRATDDHGSAERLLAASVTVPRLASLRRTFRPAPGRLVAFQLMAAPSCAPRSIRPEKFPSPRPRSRWPRFTVVTPSYQQGRFLEETIRSVVTQPGVRCDCIVQDGGSTDGSVELIGRHAAHLHASESLRDDGQADAIVRGFAKSSGEPDDLMAWINSDDFYLPGALAYVADYFASHPDVDVLYGNRIVVDEASREIGRWFLPRHDPAVLRLNDYVPQETLFWRRKIWEAVGGLNPSLKFAMDWDLLLRFDRAGARIVHVPYFLACFRVHAAQKTSAAIHQVGHREIDALRTRAFGRALSPTEVEHHPRLLAYVRRSARIEFLWRTFGLRSH